MQFSEAATINFRPFSSPSREAGKVYSLGSSGAKTPGKSPKAMRPGGAPEFVFTILSEFLEISERGNLRVASTSVFVGAKALKTAKSPCSFLPYSLSETRIN